jgi:hypothetical protein
MQNYIDSLPDNSPKLLSNFADAGVEVAHENANTDNFLSR